MSRTVAWAAGGTALQAVLAAAAGWGALTLYQLKHPGAQLLDPSVRNLWVQSFGVLFCLEAAGLIALLEMRRKGPRAAAHYGSHGTARWATRDELERRFAPEGPGLIVGQLPPVKKGQPTRYLIQPVKPRGLNAFCLITGGAGSYKTAGYIIPNILAETERSIVVPDPKGDCIRETAHTKTAQKYRILVMNFIDLARSLRWNPMDMVRKPADALRLASTIIANTENPNVTTGGGEGFWTLAEQGLLTALILYVKLHRPPEEHHLGNVLTIGTELTEEQMDALFDDLPLNDPARRQYRTFKQAEEKVRSGVLIGFGNRLQLWNDDDVIALTGTSDFDVRDLGRGKCIFYVAIPPGERTYAPLLALLWTLMTQELTRLADEHGGKLKVPVRMLLEEAANIGTIPSLAERVSTTRGQGISWELVWQTLGQFQARYPTTWSEIAGNCDTWLYLGGNDLTTLEYVSRRLGSTTIQVQSSSTSRNTKGGSDSESAQYTGRPLLMPDEMGSLDETKQLLMQRGQRPALIDKPFYLDHPLYKKPTDPPPYPTRPEEAPVLVDIKKLVAKHPPNTDKKPKRKPKEEDD